MCLQSLLLILYVCTHMDIFILDLEAHTGYVLSSQLDN